MKKKKGKIKSYGGFSIRPAVNGDYFFLGTGLLAVVFTFVLMPEYWYFAFFSEGFKIWRNKYISMSKQFV